MTAAQTIALSDSNGNNLIKFEMQQGQIKIQASGKVMVEAPQIELVQSATHPLVFGDNLLHVPESTRDRCSIRTCIPVNWRLACFR